MNFADKADDIARFPAGHAENGSGSVHEMTVHHGYGHDSTSGIFQPLIPTEVGKSEEQNGLAPSKGSDGVHADQTKTERHALTHEESEGPDSRLQHGALPTEGKQLLGSLDPNHPLAVFSTSSSAGSSGSVNNTDTTAVRSGDAVNNENMETRGMPSLFKRKDGSFVPYIGISERRLLPAPGSLDHWANAGQSQSTRDIMIPNVEIQGLVSSALANGGRSPTARTSFSTRSPSCSSASSRSPSESPKGPRSGSSSISHPLEELLVAATLQTLVGVKPGVPLASSGRSFKWSPSASRESSVSPKINPVKPTDPSLQHMKSIAQLDCTDELGSHDLASQNSSESNGTGDGRTFRSASHHPHGRSMRTMSPEGRSPKRRARRNSESPNRSFIASPHAAAKFGNLEALKRLTTLGGNIDMPNALSFTCLHMAASYGQTACVEWILSMINIADIDRCSDQGWTALHLACRSGHDAITRLLLEAGAACRVADKHGRTPLHLACIGTSTACVRLLFDRDAESLKDVDGDKWSCVHYAARCNNAEVLQVLLDCRADPNLADNDGWTPLHNCARNGQRRCVELLLQYKADLLRTNRHQETPLHVACRCSKGKVISDLLDAAVREQVLMDLVQMQDFRECTPSTACSSEDIRAAFEQKLAALGNKNHDEFRKSVSNKRLEAEGPESTHETGSDVQVDRTVLPGTSCIPSKFCCVM